MQCAGWWASGLWRWPDAWKAWPVSRYLGPRVALCCERVRKVMCVRGCQDNKPACVRYEKTSVTLSLDSQRNVAMA